MIIDSALCSNQGPLTVQWQLAQNLGSLVARCDLSFIFCLYFRWENGRKSSKVAIASFLFCLSFSRLCNCMSGWLTGFSPLKQEDNQNYFEHFHHIP